MRYSPSMAPMTEREAFEALQAENARLVALLESHGIAWHAPPAAASPAVPIASVPAPEPASPGPSLSTAEKVALFRRLFRGRTDVYPLRWESANGTSGCSPAYGNKWKPSICRKPKVKCGNFVDRDKIRIAFSWVYQAFGWGRGR